MNTKNLIVAPKLVSTIKINITLIKSIVDPSKLHQKLTIVGPLGEQTIILPIGLSIDLGQLYTKSVITFSINDTEGTLGVLVSQIKKMVQGVTEGFTKNIKLFGIGYKFNLSNSSLFINIGFSHPVEIKDIPASIKIKDINKADASVLEVFSTSLTDLNNFVYSIQRIKPVSKSFKGTGIALI